MNNSETGKKSFFSKLMGKNKRGTISSFGSPSQSQGSRKSAGHSSLLRSTPSSSTARTDGSTPQSASRRKTRKQRSKSKTDWAAATAAAKKKQVVKKKGGRFARWFSTLDPNMVLVKDFMVRGRLVMRRDRFQSMESLDWYLGIDNSELEGF